MRTLHPLLGAATVVMVAVAGSTCPALAAEDEPTPTPTPTPVLTLGRVSTPAAGSTPLPTPVTSSGIVITDSNIADYAARGKINVSGGVATGAGAARATATPGPVQVLPGLEAEAEALERAQDHVARLRQRHIQQPSAERQRAVAEAEQQLEVLRRAYEEKMRQIKPTTPTPAPSAEDHISGQLAEVESLRQRVANLEQRLAELRRMDAGADADAAARHRSQVNATEQTLAKLRGQLDRALDRLANLRAEEESSPSE